MPKRDPLHPHRPQKKAVQFPHVPKGRQAMTSVPAPAQKLLTESIRKALPPLYATEKQKDPVVQVKFFTPWTNWTWYATEFDGEDTFFGYVVGLEKELGYFSLSEMQSVTGPAGLKIERDMYFDPKPLSEVMAGHGDRMPSTGDYKRAPMTREIPKGPICPACGGPLVYTGTLGKKEWYRCRDCGAEFHKDPSRKPTGYMPGVAPQTEGSRFALYKCWIDSRGEERRVKVKQGTFADLNRWAKAEGLTFKSDSSLFGGYYLGPADEWYIADIVYGLHLGGPTKPAAPQTEGPRELPVFKGYTVDRRLRQFRKAEPGKVLEFIDFDSPEGRKLLQEYVHASLESPMGGLGRAPQAEPICPICGGPGGSMGVLGNKHWFRCRHCGMEWSKDVKRRR